MLNSIMLSCFPYYISIGGKTTNSFRASTTNVVNTTTITSTTNFDNTAKAVTSTSAATATIIATATASVFVNIRWTSYIWISIWVKELQADVYVWLVRMAKAPLLIWITCKPSMDE